MIEHIRHCKMIECGYYKQGGCQSCKECGTHEYKINTSCKKCFDCENQPSALRWEESNTQELKMIKKSIILMNERINEIKHERKAENRRIQLRQVVNNEKELIKYNENRKH